MGNQMNLMKVEMRQIGKNVMWILMMAVFIYGTTPAFMLFPP